MNKITCVRLGAQSMQRALKFYRYGLRFKTYCKDGSLRACF